MSAKIRQATLIENLVLPADQQGQAPTMVTGITNVAQVLTVRRERIVLEEVLVAITAALDYSSQQLLTLPNTNILILGTVVNVVGVKDGTGVTDITAADIAVGSVTTASTDFSNAGEDDYVEKIDLATAAGLGQGASLDNGTPAILFLPAAADNKIWLNNSVAITGDGSITYTGTIDVFWLDLGVPA